MSDSANESSTYDVTSVVYSLAQSLLIDPFIITLPTRDALHALPSL